MDNFEDLDLTEHTEEVKPINDILRQFEYLSLTIVMEPLNKDKLNDNGEEKDIKIEAGKLRSSFKEEPNAVNPEKTQSLPDEYLLNLIERIEKRQKEYQKLIDKAKKTELHDIYSEEDCHFSIKKQSKKFSEAGSSTDTESSSNSDNEPEACGENATSEPSGSNTKTKSEPNETGPVIEQYIKPLRFSEAGSSTDTETSSISDNEPAACVENSISEPSGSNIKTKGEPNETDPVIDKDIKPSCSTQYPNDLDSNQAIIIIGPNGTGISHKDLEKIKWKDASGATRDLCEVIFGRKILASHSLKGYQLPAFRGEKRPIKPLLDVHKVSDITQLVCDKFNVTRQFVKATITTECADAANMAKLQAKKIKLN